MAYYFVGGSQRSGTTLLQILLCQDRTTNPMIREASYLGELVNLYQSAKRQISDNLKDYFHSLQDIRNFHAGIVLAFLERTRQRLGNCDSLALKEPHLTMQFPHLHELIPDARFLVIIRDPRDTIASMLEVGRKMAALGQQYIFVSRNIPALCQHYKSFYIPVFTCPNKQFQQQVMTIRYEDLVQRPQEMIQHLRRFTGLTFDGLDPTAEPDTGRVNYRDLASHQLYQPWQTDLFGKQISDAKIGKYRDSLSDEEIKQVEYCCADFLELCKYTTPVATNREECHSQVTTGERCQPA